MTFFWINLALVFTFSFFARYSASATITSFNTVPMVTIKPNKILVFGALLTLVLISGLRSNIGDTFNYKNIYSENDFTWDYILGQKDIGFGIFQMILKQFSTDPQLMIFTTAFFTNTLIFIILFKYSRMIELSLFVYITSGLFLVSMNGIRQSLASAIAFTAIKFLIDGNWIKYSLIVLFASFFHQSALILIPIYFVVRYKAWSKVTIALVLFSVIIVFGFNLFSAFLYSAIADTQYADYKGFHEGGANSIRVIVSAVPLLIAFMGRDKLRTIFPDSDVIINMALLGFVFMMISTQNWIFARFYIYFGLYQLILVSWIVKLFRKKDEKLVYYGILVCYFVYYYYENVISLNIFYKSDYLIW